MRPCIALFSIAAVDGNELVLDAPSLSFLSVIASPSRRLPLSPPCRLDDA